MVIKEMPLAEKYDKLLDSFLISAIAYNALLKELGAVEKGIDLSVDVSAKMFPSRVGIAFDLLKTIAPGTAFTQLVENYAYSLQGILALNDFEVNRVSDREATIRIANCPVLTRMRRLVEKTGVTVDPKSFCEVESQITEGVAATFGVSMVTELTDNGCMTTAKLRLPLIIL